MGRGVSYHRNEYAGITLHEDFEEEDDSYAWEDFKDNLIENFKSIAPTISKAEDDEWYGNETKLLAENGFTTIWLSEYCGVIRISFVPKEQGWATNSNITRLSKRWLDSIVPKIEKKFVEYKYTVLRRLGSFSNGETVYNKVN